MPDFHLCPGAIDTSKLFHALQIETGEDTRLRKERKDEIGDSGGGVRQYLKIDQSSLVEHHASVVNVVMLLIVPAGGKDD